jgi:glycerol-3-phosphate dehydrogenase
VVRRRFPSRYALALQGRTRDPDAVLSRPARHLFLVPWRSFTLIGVWHVVYDRSPDEVSVGAEELESFIDKINWAYPGLSLSPADVTLCNAGLVPFGENEHGATNLRYGKRSHLIDHERTHGLEGLVTLIGIRYTMARGGAVQAMDLICYKLGKPMRRPTTERKPLLGVRPKTVSRALARGHAASGKRRVTQLKRRIGLGPRVLTKPRGHHRFTGRHAQHAQEDQWPTQRAPTPGTLAEQASRIGSLGWCGPSCVRIEAWAAIDR